MIDHEPASSSPSPQKSIEGLLADAMVNVPEKKVYSDKVRMEQANQLLALASGLDDNSVALYGCSAADTSFTNTLPDSARLPQCCADYRRLLRKAP